MEIGPFFKNGPIWNRAEQPAEHQNQKGDGNALTHSNRFLRLPRQNISYTFKRGIFAQKKRENTSLLLLFSPYLLFP